MRIQYDICNFHYQQNRQQNTDQDKITAKRAALSQITDGLSCQQQLYKRQHRKDESFTQSRT